MKLEISDEEVVCIAFWYTVFKDMVKVTEFDKKLFERVNALLILDTGVPWEERGYTSMPKYQPGEKINVET